MHHTTDETGAAPSTLLVNTAIVPVKRRRRRTADG